MDLYFNETTQFLYTVSIMFCDRLCIIFILHSFILVVWGTLDTMFCLLRNNKDKSSITIKTTKTINYFS